VLARAPLGSAGSQSFACRVVLAEPRPLTMLDSGDFSFANLWCLGVPVAEQQSAQPDAATAVTRDIEPRSPPSIAAMIAVGRTTGIFS